MRYRSFVNDLALYVHDMSPDGLLRRLNLASDLNLLPDADDSDCADISLLTFISAFTKAVKTVWDRIFHAEIQEQRRAGDTPPKRKARDWCRMYLAAFYKAKLLRHVPRKLQDEFEAFVRSLESVYLVDDEDVPPSTSRQRQDVRADPPPLSAASDTTNLPPHPFQVLRDRFSEAGQASVPSDSVTSCVSAQMDGQTQVCTLRTPPLPYHLVLRCYAADDVRGVPYRGRWRHAYARFSVHIDGQSEVHDALNAFLLRVANDMLARGGTHRQHESH
jgi:hypothetical protein